MPNIHSLVGQDINQIRRNPSSVPVYIGLIRKEQDTPNDKKRYIAYYRLHKAMFFNNTDSEMNYKVRLSALLGETRGWGSFMVI